MTIYRVIVTTKSLRTTIDVVLIIPTITAMTTI